MIFKDREEAGRRLAPRLEDLEDDVNTVIVGLARGGVIVAKEVARDLGLPLEILVAKKLGAPGNPELAIGAIAESMRILDEKLIKELRVSQGYIAAETVKLEQEISRRVERYRKGKPLLDLNGKTVVLIDDGIATGATMRAAIQYAKAMGARETVVAVPVASEEPLQEIEKKADRVVCLEKLGPYFSAVGEHYENFPQVSDEEVIDALASIHEVT